MIEVMQFVFSSFWIWLGTLLIIGAIATAFANVIQLFKK